MSPKNQGEDHKDAKHANPSARSRYPAPFSLRLSEDERQAALTVLGLQDPVENTDIKMAYRRLAMAHHPDRGGDEETLKEINLAAKTLLG